VPGWPPALVVEALLAAPVDEEAAVVLLLVAGALAPPPQARAVRSVAEQARRSTDGDAIEATGSAPAA
jgi:hypothetical protein